MDHSDIDAFIEHMNEVTVLTVEQARILLAYCLGGLSLNGLSELQLEVAQVFAGFNGFLELNGLTGLAPDVAKVLATCRGSLSLNGLATLSVEAAEALAQHEGASIDLDGLKTINKDVARALASYEGELSLSGLEEIGREASRELLEKGGGRLYLFGFSKSRGFEHSGPGEMVLHQGQLIRLESIEHVTPRLAEDLARHNDSLHLPRVTSLNEEVAQILSTYSGRYLDLSGITSLSREVAEALAAYNGYLSLDGLTTLRRDAAEALARRKRRSFLESIEDYDIEEGEVEDLLEAKDAHEDSVRYLTQDLADRVIRRDEAAAQLGSLMPTEETTFVFAKRHGELSLNRLREVEQDVAEILSQHEGDLKLFRLASLTSVALARKLARGHSYELFLGGVTTLQQDIAEIVATHTGRLMLDGLPTMSLAVAKALVKHDGPVSLLGLREISPDVAATLTTHPHITLPYGS